MQGWMWTGANPIDRAAIAIEFAAPFAQPVLQEASLRHRVLKRMFPRRINQQAMVVQFGQSPGFLPMQTPVQVPETSGFTFDKTDEAGQQIKAVNMSGNSIVFSSSAYTRWNSIWPEAYTVFSEFVPIIEGSGNFAASITLEYANNFIWSGDYESCDVSILLKNSPFVCQNAFRTVGLWHSFHGFFREAIGCVDGQHLENINLMARDLSGDANDPAFPKRCIDIIINHKFIFSKPRSFGLSESPSDAPILDLGEHVTFMHQRNKEILRDLLREPIISEITGLDVAI